MYHRILTDRFVWTVVSRVIHYTPPVPITRDARGQNCVMHGDLVGHMVTLRVRG
jgi:hypothetical protein